MSILVRNVEMPKDCRECRLMEYHNSTGKTWCAPADGLLAEDFRPIPFDGRPEWCPLVEIKTPHGDLIDRDAFFSGLSHEDIQFSFHVDGTFVDVTKINKILQNQPVVVEAEGEE